MSSSDYIAIVAILVAFLSAYYARQARDANRKANAIELHGQRRPLRLAVYQAMTSFAMYCSRYVTLYHMKGVNGTRDLVAQIDAFKSEIELYGHLDMPDVEAKCEEFIKRAWQMQRLLDEMVGGQNQAMDSRYASAEEHLDAVVEGFATERRDLRNLFQKCLSADAA